MKMPSTRVEMCFSTLVTHPKRNIPAAHGTLQNRRQPWSAWWHVDCGPSVDPAEGRRHMRLRRQALTVSAILIAGLAVANCGGETDSGGSPTSPSQQAGSGENSPTPPPPGNVPIEVEGLIQNLTGSCPNLAFLLAGRRVQTTSATQFNRIPCTLLQNGMDVEVDGTPGAGGVLAAREVQPDEVDLEGTVAGLTGTCPDRRFTVNGTPVVALASTRFDDVSCLTLRDALRVEVRGIRRSDGSLLLTRVKPRGEVSAATSVIQAAAPSGSAFPARRRVAA